MNKQAFPWAELSLTRRARLFFERGARADPVRADDDQGARAGRSSSCRRRSTSTTSSTSRHKSLVGSTFESGVQTFAVSWRNPTRSTRTADSIRTPKRSRKRSTRCARSRRARRQPARACSGGITLTALLGYLAAGGERKVNAATLRSVLEHRRSQRDGGLFVTPATIAAAKAASRKRRVVGARTWRGVRVDATQRSGLELRGQQLPAGQRAAGARHPVLEQRRDHRLPAGLHADFLDLFESNAFCARQLRVRGRKVDLGAIGIDTYVVGGLTDHITPWQGVHRPRSSTVARAEFVAVQRWPYPEPDQSAGQQRSWFRRHPRVLTPEAWLARRSKNDRKLVGALARVDSRSAPTLRPAPAATEASATLPHAGASAPTCSSDYDAAMRVNYARIHGRRIRYAVRPAIARRRPGLLNGIGANIEREPFIDALAGPAVVTSTYRSRAARRRRLRRTGRRPWRAWPTACSTTSGYGEVDVLGVSWGGAIAQQLVPASASLPPPGTRATAPAR